MTEHIPRIRMACALLAGLSAGPALAFDWYPVYQVPAPITVDGALNEPAWRAAAPIHCADLVTGARPLQPVTARLLWDRRFLYAAFEVQETNVWARLTGRDVRTEPGGRRYVESFFKLYLDPGRDGRRYTEMHLSANGSLSDKWQTLPWRPEARARLGLPVETEDESFWDWDCTGLVWAVQVQGTLNEPSDLDRGWTAELAIPFAALAFLAHPAACPPAPGDIWGAHLGRRYAPSPGAPDTDVQYWTWPRLGERNCHRPDRWGRLVFYTNTLAVLADPAAVPPGRFDWKLLWVRAGALKTPEAVERMGDDAVRMGFTHIGAEPRADIIRVARARKLGFYAWWINLRHPAGAGLRQCVAPEEMALAGTPRVNPDRENIHGASWLCPDAGLTDAEWQAIEAMLREHEVDGLALDYIGYRNYYACFCEASQANRREYAERHPGLPPDVVEWRASEDALVAYTQQIRDRLRALDPRLKLAIHVYPDFDPNPVYGCRLPVDYCGQTVAWFFKPHWPLERVYALTQQHAGIQHDVHPAHTFVPFVGVYAKDRVKPPDQLRAEIRMAGTAGTGALMISFYETFLEHPELIGAVADELNPPAPR